MAIQLRVNLETLSRERMDKIEALLQEHNLSMDQVVERSLILFYVAVNSKDEQDQECASCQVSSASSS